MILIDIVKLASVVHGNENEMKNINVRVRNSVENFEGSIMNIRILESIGRGMLLRMVL